MLLLTGSASEGEGGRLLKEAKADAGLQPVCREGEVNIRVVKAWHKQHQILLSLGPSEQGSMQNTGECEAQYDDGVSSCSRSCVTTSLPADRL